MKTMMANLGWMLLTACSSLPVTDGFHRDLPKPGTATIVWGDDLSAVGMATTWLQKRGLAVVERSLLVLDFESETMNLGHTLKDEATVLQAAKKRGAAQVVFVDRGGDYRAPMITVRGVDVESGRVQWTGSARYAVFEARPPKDTLANLTCEALATAWEFRPSGTKWFMSSYEMCGVASAK